MGQQRVGGQALGDGVMLRAGRRVAVAVRRQDGSIDVEAWEQPGRGGVVDRIPVVRILAGLGAALAGAARAARVAGRTRRSSGSRRGARLLGLVAFIAVAQALGWLLWQQLAPTATVFGAARGAVAQGVALAAAIALARLTPAGQRLFTYHGAEHQAVRAHELGFAPDVDPHVVTRLSPVHPRCGTHLALWLTIEAGALGVVRHGVLANGVMQVVIVVISMGIVAELLRLAGDRLEWWPKVLRAPGSALQRLTTRRAGPAECEVALAALDAALGGLPTARTGIERACTSDLAPLRSS